VVLRRKENEKKVEKDNDRAPRPSTSSDSNEIADLKPIPQLNQILWLSPLGVHDRGLEVGKRRSDNVTMGKNGRTVLHDQHQLGFLLQGC
jgi:hypothetical protein